MSYSPFLWRVLCEENSRITSLTDHGGTNSFSRLSQVVTTRLKPTGWSLRFGFHLLY